MTQTANDPAAIAVAPGHGSTIPRKEKEMNSQTNTTAPAELPVRPMKLQMLDIYDLASRVGSLIDALDMATTDIMDSRQRNAMASACDVLMGQMDDLKGLIETAREEMA